MESSALRTLQDYIASGVDEVHLDIASRVNPGLKNISNLLDLLQKLLQTRLVTKNTTVCLGF